MTEEFLHYLWKYRMISGDLKTVSGEKIEILKTGEHNNGSGPDFLNARIRIGNNLWAGNVEVHVNGSDWYRHSHDSDRAYDNVILHVVYNHDRQVYDASGKPFQTLVVDRSFPDDAYLRYRHFMDNSLWIPCEKLVTGVEQTCFDQWAYPLVAERLKQKVGDFKVTWESTGYDWDLTFFRHLVGSFGFNINSDAFGMLAESVPMKLMLSLQGDPVRLESLLFGQSGLLCEDFTEAYPLSLKAQYELLRQKHSLNPLPAFLWRFLRLRPSNFPTVRIAQLAALLNRHRDLFSLLLSAPDSETVMEAFSVKASGFWDSHYHFTKLSTRMPKILGRASIHLLMVNFVIPFLFFYGKEKEDEAIRNRALQWLESLPAEENADLSRWKSLGLRTGNALRAQALLGLKKDFCDRKKCLECRIGRAILTMKDQ